MRIAWDNKIDDYTPEVSSESGNFPATNVRDSRLSTPWRTTGASAQYFILDAGSGNTITAICAAIAAHNLTSGATVKIQGNATDSWGAPSVDETITYNADIMMKFFTGGAYRFWRFYFNDAVNPDGYIEIGRLFLGSYYQAPEQPGPDLVEDIVDTSTVSYSPTGQAYADIGVKYRRYSIGMGTLKEATRQGLLSLFDSIGRYTAVFLLLDENNLTKLPIVYCVMDKDFQFSHIGGYVWRDGTFQFREVF